MTTIEKLWRCITPASRTTTRLRLSQILSETQRCRTYWEGSWKSIKKVKISIKRSRFDCIKGFLSVTFCSALEGDYKPSEVLLVEDGVRKHSKSLVSVPLLNCGTNLQQYFILYLAMRATFGTLRFFLYAWRFWKLTTVDNSEYCLFRVLPQYFSWSCTIGI